MFWERKQVITTQCASKRPTQFTERLPGLTLTYTTLNNCVNQLWCARNRSSDNMAKLLVYYLNDQPHCPRLTLLW